MHKFTVRVFLVRRYLFICLSTRFEPFQIIIFSVHFAWPIIVKSLDGAALPVHDDRFIVFDVCMQMGEKTIQQCIIAVADID